MQSEAFEHGSLPLAYILPAAVQLTPRHGRAASRATRRRLRVGVAEVAGQGVDVRARPVRCMAEGGGEKGGMWGGFGGWGKGSKPGNVENTEGQVAKEAIVEEIEAETQDTETEGPQENEHDSKFRWPWQKKMKESQIVSVSDVIGEEHVTKEEENSGEEPEEDGGSTERLSNVDEEDTNGIDKKRDFRWPWQKGNGVVAKGESSVKNSSEIDSPVQKKVAHTDSKPAGSFVPKYSEKTDENERVPEKSDWQEKWDGIIRVIAPNLNQKDKGTEAVQMGEQGEKSKLGNVVSEKDQTAEDIVSNRGGVPELYEPPSADSKNRRRQQDAKSSRWPQMPWDKEKRDKVISVKSDGQASGEPSFDKTIEGLPSKGPRISRVPDVSERTIKKESRREVKSSTEKNENSRKVKENEGKGKEAISSDGEEMNKATLGKKEKNTVTALASTKANQQNQQSPNTLQDSVSIPQRDIASIRLIFGSETFFATETVSPPGGLIFRGNLRGEPKATIEKLEERLAARMGDKYTLCLAEGEEDLRPVVVIVPTARDTKPPTPKQRFTATMIGVITLVTLCTRGLLAAFYKPIITKHYPPPGPSILSKVFAFPTGIAVITAIVIYFVIVASQIVQRMVASRYGTRVSLPYFLPSLQLGSFGAVVQLSSPTPTRAALFDIALSGAATIVGLSLIMLLAGLRLSTSFPLVTPVPLTSVSSSVVIGFLTKQVPDGKILVDYGRSLIGLHPLAVIGANCLTIAALNLLPLRHLDGGRIISALYGRRTAVNASRITTLFLLLASTRNTYYVVFLAAMTFGPWNIDRPSKNELTEPNGLRTIVGYLFMLLMVGVLLPYPASKFFGTL